MTGKKGIEVCPGNPVVLGANKIPSGMNFAVEAPSGARVSLVLYRKGSEEPCKEIPFTENQHSGKIYSMLLTGFDESHFEYNFRIDDEIVCDPCAYGIVGREHFGAAPDAAREHSIRGAFLSYQKYDWQGDAAPKIPYDKMILYKLHVRGFTKQARMARRLKGTFSGVVEMIPYFKELGINALELMPACEFAETSPQNHDDGSLIRQKKETDRVNFWGYTGGFYFAPKRSYCATKNPEKEFRDMVRALHTAGIECIMEMYFPAGTPPLRALQALWFWKMHYHVDGFHLSGDGVPEQLIREDKLLYGTKRMFSAIHAQTEAEDMFAEYNAGFLEDMRRFLKSDEGMVARAEYHIRRNTGAFGTINYIAGQDGFTLNDTVSYNYRHNEGNSENNRDGSDFNYSWNCGEEGPSRKKSVRHMREQQMRNAFLMLLLSQGTPMIYAGDEFGNSQEGNNNAWCQDNPVGWTDWKALKKNTGLQEFVREAIAFRKEHPILHNSGELRGVDYLAKGFPDVSFHGERAWYLNTENTSRLLGVMYCGLYAVREDGSTDDFLYVGYNFHWENRRIALPNLPEGLSWHKCADTSEDGAGGWFRMEEEVYKKNVEIHPRTIVVLIAAKEEEKDEEKDESSSHASMASL